MKVLFAFLLCAFSLFLGAQQKDSLKLEIKNMGSQINSSSSDYAPLISADGSTMIFTSRRIPPNAESPITNTKNAGQKNTEKKDGNECIYITYYNNRNKTWLEPILLDPVVNLVGVDNAALALSNDGQKMLLYRGGNNKNIYKGIFESTLNGNEWSVPTRLPSPINGDGYETTASYSPDGKTIYFVSSRLNGYGGQDIWYCTQEAFGNWGEAVNMGDSINSAEDEESVFMHPNGSSLFFSSKGHNSMGGYDIFVSNFDTTANVWGKAKNLGSSINTTGDDLYFVMAADEKTAFYASTKPKGLGGNDIYSITVNGNIIKQRVALLKGFVIDENGLGVKSTIVVNNKTTDKTINTLTSNKATGKYVVSLPVNSEYEIIVTDDNNGTYNESVDVFNKTTYTEIVKNIVLEPKFATVFSKILDEKGNPIKGIQIELIDITTMQIAGKFETNKEGNMHLFVPFEKKFNIVLSKPGYLFQTVNLSIPKSNGSEPKILNNITMQNVEVGKKVVLNNIYFDFNQSIPRDQTFFDLDRVVALMDNMKSLQLEISGHTDNVGFQDNRKLSEQRAKSVVKYLIHKGCAKKRLKYKGCGPSEPIATNETEEGRQANNRIEMKVLKVDLVAEQKAEEKRKKENSANVNLTETTNSADEENTQENKDSITTAVKKEESIDAFSNDTVQGDKENNVVVTKKEESIDTTKQETVTENKETNLVAVKKEESIDTTDEETIIENKETDVTPVKKEENTDTTKEEKVKENTNATITKVKKDKNSHDAIEEKTQKKKETNATVVKKEEPIDATKKENVKDNKEANLVAVKNEGNIDTTKEEPILENKKTNATVVKKEEPIDATEKGSVKDNKEANLVAVKNEENIDTTKEEPILENKETNVTAVKKEESIDTTDEETIVENKETDVTAVKKEESIDTTKEEKVKENKTDNNIEAKKDEIIYVAIPEKGQKKKGTNATVVKKEETIDTAKKENVKENKVTNSVAVKNEENTDTTSEETIIENKETTAVNKTENFDSINVVLLQKNKELTKKIETLEQKYNEQIDSANNVIRELSHQENKAPIVIADKKEANIDSADEDEIQVNKEADVPDVKKKESVDSTTEVTEVKTNVDDETNVTAVKTDESIDEANRKKLQEFKKTIEAKSAKNDSLDSTKEEHVATTKKDNQVQKEENSLLPERFKKFDKDLNGTISYEEIINMIDSFFENDPNVKGEDIVAAIDYFFGN